MRCNIVVFCIVSFFQSVGLPCRGPGRYTTPPPLRFSGATFVGLEWCHAVGRLYVWVSCFCSGPPGLPSELLSPGPVSSPKGRERGSPVFVFLSRITLGPKTFCAGFWVVFPAGESPRSTRVPKPMVNLGLESPQISDGTLRCSVPG